MNRSVFPIALAAAAAMLAACGREPQSADAETIARLTVPAVSGIPEPTAGELASLLGRERLDLAAAVTVSKAEGDHLFEIAAVEAGEPGAGAVVREAAQVLREELTTYFEDRLAEEISRLDKDLEAQHQRVKAAEKRMLDLMGEVEKPGDAHAASAEAID